MRGVVQLSSALRETHAAGRWPAAVNGIPIRRMARRLHFLLGVGRSRRMVADNDPSASFARMPGMLPPVLSPGTEMARFLVHYADGSTEELPLGPLQTAECDGLRIFDGEELAPKRV